MPLNTSAASEYLRNSYIGIALEVLLSKLMILASTIYREAQAPF
jgi:hypothetical protein